MMKNTLSFIVAAVLLIGTAFAGPAITDQEVKPNGNVKIRMTSDTPFVLVGTSDFVNYVVLKEYNSPKNNAVYIDKKRQANEPYFFYFVVEK